MKMKALKYKFLVEIVKEVEIELNPEVFGGLSVDEYLKQFSSQLWKVDSIQDVARYAANCAVNYGDGYSHDGIGLVSSNNYRRKPEVMFDIISEECEISLLEDYQEDDDVRIC